MNLPKIIQGGMGIGVSDWRLARSVSRLGQLGVVSGTAIDAVLSRRLQLGDPEGDIRRAFAAFPFPEISQRILERYFVEGGKPAAQPFRGIPLSSMEESRFGTELTVLANFTEVYLAKEGHDGLVGINFLEKIQTKTLASLYGAMLARTDFVLMGAGIPRSIPGILDLLAAGQPATLRLDVEQALPGEEFALTFDPSDFCGGTPPVLQRPKFLAIVSSDVLALSLAKKSSGKVDGFVVEGASAGGHNAPPRGALQLNERGEPLYGDRDRPDLEKIKKLGLPFWLAGSFGVPGGLSQALALGAVGIQAGTPFAFCEESGITPEIKQSVLKASREGTLQLFTDPYASPTGFPFKVVGVAGSLSDPDIYAKRERICDLGFLRQAYRQPDGTAGFRCSAGPVEQFEAKGGDPTATEGRRCLCNALLSTIGLGQALKNGGEEPKVEPPIITAGDQVAQVAEFLKPGEKTYSAKQVLEALLA